MNDLLISLAVILVAAEVGAAAAQSLHLPRAMGQILVGLILGPSVLGIVGRSDVVTALAEVGGFCILAVAGLETNLAVMRRVGRAATLAAAGGVVLPFLGGLAVAMATGFDLRAGLFAGAVLTATSVGITAAVLAELRLLRSTAGMTILGAAVIDDVLGLVVLALVVADTTSHASLLATLAPMAVTLAVAGIVLRWMSGHVHLAVHHLHIRGGGNAAVLGLVLAAGWAFQALGGLAGITGAYLAGLALAGSPLAPELRQRLVHAGETFAIPVFFVAIGLAADLRPSCPSFRCAVAFLVVAVAGKVAGAAIGARLGGLDGRASSLVGVGMIARGEVALVAAALGLQSGAISGGLYAAMILVALATTIITPLAITGWTRWVGRTQGAQATAVGEIGGLGSVAAGMDFE